MPEDKNPIKLVVPDATEPLEPAEPDAPTTGPPGFVGLVFQPIAKRFDDHPEIILIGQWKIGLSNNAMAAAPVAVEETLLLQASIQGGAKAVRAVLAQLISRIILAGLKAPSSQGAFGSLLPDDLKHLVAEGRRIIEADA